MSWALPKEIISHEIFSKLPAKSLLRFKCVSKYYNALISSPEFVELHVCESRSSDANRLLILAGRDCRNLYSTGVDSPDDMVSTIPLPRIPDESSPEVSIVGSFDGLICVVLGGSRGTCPKFKHLIINPSTRVFREIPYKHTPAVSGFVNTQFSLGFGFDDLNRDFKLVRITEVYDRREVIVYSLNENTWKLVEIINGRSDSLCMAKPNSLAERQNGVLIKNHLLHWLFYESYHYRIGCFDTQTDKWARDVPLTMNLFEGRYGFTVQSLGVINECLCLFTAGTSSEVVWILKDYETKESWVKLFDHIPSFLMTHFFRFTQPFFCFPRGSKYEVLLANCDRKGILWYDIGLRTYGRIKYDKRIPAFVGGCLFTGSLVQIPGGRRISQDKLNY